LLLLAEIGLYTFCQVKIKFAANFNFKPKSKAIVKFQQSREPGRTKSEFSVSHNISGNLISLLSKSFFQSHLYAFILLAEDWRRFISTYYFYCFKYFLLSYCSPFLYPIAAQFLPFRLRANAYTFRNCIFISHLFLCTQLSLKKG